MRKTVKKALAGLLASAAALSAAPAAADGMPVDPLPRFEEPLCPGVIGLQFDYAVAMVARIRENASKLGLRLAVEEGCDPNLIISFLNDGQDYLQRLNSERGWVFEAMERSEKRALLSATGPARTWITTETRTRDGLQIGRRDNLVDVPQAGMWSAHSLIYVPTRQDITASMVLIDRSAIEGRSLAQLADYATLHGLSEFVPEAASNVASIQNLFETTDATPEGLTEFDMAYLQRLYSSIPNLPAYTRLEGLEGIAGLE